MIPRLRRNSAVAVEVEHHLITQVIPERRFVINIFVGQFLERFGFILKRTIGIRDLILDLELGRWPATHNPIP